MFKHTSKPDERHLDQNGGTTETMGRIELLCGRSFSQRGVGMQLGYVTAILPDWTLEQHMEFATKQGFDCLEVMCWPVGKAERRYAGVTHIDVNNFSQADAERVKSLMRQYSINISSLGYYPNPLVADL